MPTSYRNRAARPLTHAGLLVGIALLLVVPLMGATATAREEVGAAGVAAGSLITAGATWNGQPLATAAGTAHAFGVTSGASVEVVFSYTYSLVNAPKPPTARITVVYFGAAISTDQVGSHNTTTPGAGTAVMNWTLGTFSYLLAGVYELTASLVGSGGASLWSQSFYINVHAPDHIASGLIVFLVLLGLVEIWGIATVGRMPRRPSVTSSSGPSEWQPPADADAGASAPGGTPPTPPPPTGDGGSA